MLSVYTAIGSSLLAVSTIVRVIVRARLTRQIASEALANSDPKDRPEILKALPK
ncbi:MULTISPECIES: hypothetical protein [unclassified Kitasatospora]|uniref:hypothetical protein n=1 Tax=unclassified Kitasatospora TaxID=2633591 RepID=UPI0036D8968E